MNIVTAIKRVLFPPHSSDAKRDAAKNRAEELQKYANRIVLNYEGGGDVSKLLCNIAEDINNSASAVMSEIYAGKNPNDALSKLEKKYRDLSPVAFAARCAAEVGGKEDDTSIGAIRRLLYSKER